MKTKILSIAFLAAGLLLAACSSSDDDNVTVDKTYRMYVGVGSVSKLGTESPALTALDYAATAEALQISNSLDDITITGKGKNEQEAMADAERQAKTIYDMRAEAVILKLINIKANFEANRRLSAAEILTETGYYTKITLRLFLAEDTGGFEDTIIEESDSYYMEAIGGEDYS